MNIYIWQRIANASDAYHPEGGLVVIAETEAKARELAKYGKAYPHATEPPDAVFPLARSVHKKAAQVFVFPDAGCC